MKIIVDTNIVFSAILNTSGKIGDLLFNSGEIFQFYTPSFLRVEITRNYPKLQEMSDFDEILLNETVFYVYNLIKFISDEQIPFNIWHKCIPLVRDVDMDDLAFLALNEHLNGKLWTGDKPLYKGLKAKGYEEIVSTDELLKIRDEYTIS